MTFYILNQLYTFFETQNSKLKTCNSKLETQNSKLIIRNLFLPLFILFTTTVSAQFYVNISSTNNQPGVGDKFKLTYELKLKVENGVASVSHHGIQIKKPPFDGFTVVDEGRASNGFGFGGFGGDMKVSDYAFILQAKKKGTFTIPPLTFIMNGEEYQSESYAITVGEGDPNAKIAAPQNSNLFTRIDVSKKSPYKGQSVLVTYKIYSRYRSLSLDDYDYKIIDGVWTEEINPGKNGWEGKQETINGLVYNVYTLKKEIIFPQKTGEIEIPPFEITARIGQSFFNQGRTETVHSNSQKLSVNSLPSGAPQSYNGQVGSDYKMDIEYSTTEVKANEAIDLKIKISGKGNLKQLDAPELKFPTDFEVYDPEIKEDIKLSTSGLTGSKEFSYLIIPRHHGTFSVDEIKFSYFDINSKKYKTLSSPATNFNILQGEDENGNLITTADKEDVELLSNEIRHIKQDTALYANDNFLFGTSNFWLMLASPGVLFFLLLFIKRRRGGGIDEVALSKKNASKVANQKLAKAEGFLKNDEDAAFFEELHRALNDYLSKKLDLQQADLKKSRIEDELKLLGVDSSNITQLFDILNNCEMARYAPVSHAAAEQYLKNSKTIINTIESHAKK